VGIFDFAGGYSLRRLMLLLGVSMLWASPAFSACTDGVDCYCDRVIGGDLNDTLLLMCEDWEHPGFYAGSPNAVATAVDNRGDISQIRLIYANGVGSSLIQDLEPAGTPYTGPQCVDPDPKFGCVATNEYCSAAQGTEASITTTGGGDDGINCWGSATTDVNARAFIDIQSPVNEDYKSEITDLLGPTTSLSNGGHHLAHRNPAGAGNTAGLTASKSLGGGQATIGLTMLFAYSSNLVDSGILTSQWKQDEWEDSIGANKYNMFPLAQPSCLNGTTPAEPGDGFPFCPFMGDKRGGRDAPVGYCAINVGVVQTTGTVSCGNPWTWVFQPETGTGALWKATDDLVYDEWMCVEFYLAGAGTSSVTMQIWATTPTIDHLKVLDISNLDMTEGGGQITEFHFGNYANLNATELNPSGPWTSETVYRHEDNIHIRAGLPVTCAQIGFGAGAAATASMAGGSITGGSAN